ncbi:hypothetical protein ACELLULO517_15790 [Acidisoma cellulosilytica]|uniref:Uncharacterized protein n=1 Tax=Acidisoma cellulosilyticum TaxID=2802395 RepID=A0A963Z2S7_9PROT|nr:hypothetical protein [Acidisoma cellulosilyticum]MCB8881710.1 hypothetical protein [Acidisoma cellulosilyticum]
MMEELFEIGVKLSLDNRLSSGLHVISRDLIGVQGHVDETEKGLKRLRTAAVAAGAAAAGTGIAAGMWDAAKAGAQLVSIQAKISSAGKSQADVAAMTAAAWRTSGQVMGTSITDNLKLAADLRDTFGSLGESISSLPQMAKAGVVIHRFTGTDAENGANTLGKFLENRGALIDPATGKVSESRFLSESSLAQGIIAGTNGRVDQNKLYGLSVTGRGALTQMSDQGLIDLAPYLQTQDGQRTGTTLTALQRQLFGGGRNLTLGAAEALQKAGVLKKGFWHQVKGKGIVIDPGAYVNEDHMQSDIAGWTWDTLLPGLQAEGVNTKDPKALLRAVLGLHLNSNVAGMLFELINNKDSYQKDIANNIVPATKTDQYKALLNGNPILKMQALTTAFDNLITAIGSPLVGKGSDFLLGLAADIDKLTAVAVAHPEAVKFLDKTALALAGLMIAGGAITVFTLSVSPFLAALKLLIGGLKAGEEEALLPGVGVPFKDSSGRWRAGNGRFLSEAESAAAQAAEVGVGAGGSAAASKLPLLRDARGRVMSATASAAKRAETWEKWAADWGGYDLSGDVGPTAKAATKATAKAVAKRGLLSSVLPWIPGIGEIYDLTGNSTSAGAGEDAAFKSWAAKQDADKSAATRLQRTIDTHVQQLQKSQPTKSSPMPVVVVGGQVGATITNPLALHQGTASAMTNAMSSAADAGFSTVNRRQVPVSPSQTGLR